MIGSWLLLGFAMGVRHALEADHIAAVASLSARAHGRRDLLRVAGAWGLGHALTLVALASLWVFSGVTVPEAFQPWLEAAAGGLLVWLGIDLLRRRDRLGPPRLDAHQHSDGTHHVHIHWDSAQPSDDAEHRHPPHPIARSVWVGAVHGLAGSAILGVLAAQGALPVAAIAYAVLFGLGATAGMLVLSTAVSVPLAWPSVRAFADGRTWPWALGTLSIVLGCWVGGRALFPDGLL